MTHLKLNNKYIGAHVSSLYGIDKTVIRAFSINAKAFSFFLGSNIKWYKYISNTEINNFILECRKYNISNKYILPHGSFLVNLGHYNRYILSKSRDLLIKEINYCDDLLLRYINIHPGSHLNMLSLDKCLLTIACSINYILAKTKKIIIVLENTAGQGTNVGYKFEHIAQIIDSVEDKSRIGVCIDTCHAFVAGYDLRTFYDCEKVFNDFNRIIGIKYLKGIHLNGSKGSFASKKDRHDELRNSLLGNIIFYWLVRNIIFDNMPVILETKNPSLWLNEINWLNSL